MDESGTLHAVCAPGLAYSACAGGCAEPSWAAVELSGGDAGWPHVAAGDGAVGIVFEQDGMRFAKCRGGCDDAGAWRIGAPARPAFAARAPRQLAIGRDGAFRMLAGRGDDGEWPRPSGWVAVCTRDCADDPDAWMWAPLDLPRRGLYDLGDVDLEFLPGSRGDRFGLFRRDFFPYSSGPHDCWPEYLPGVQVWRIDLACAE